MGGWLRLPLRDGQPFYLCPRRRANHGEVGSGGVQAVVGESAVVALQVNAGKVPLEQEGPAGSAAVVQPDAPGRVCGLQSLSHTHRQGLHEVPVFAYGADGAMGDPLAHEQGVALLIYMDAGLLAVGVQHLPALDLLGEILSGGQRRGTVCGDCPVDRVDDLSRSSVWR